MIKARGRAERSADPRVSSGQEGVSRGRAPEDSAQPGLEPLSPRDAGVTLQALPTAGPEGTDLLGGRRGHSLFRDLKQDWAA